jgi:transposase InsO family protein
MMKGKPASIELSSEAKATSTGHYRVIADAYLEPLKKELDIQVRAGIIEKLEEKPEASKYWLHPIVVVPKKGTKDVRLCVDFRKLNKFCLRPTNPQKTPLETVRSLPAGQEYFAVFDALKGYHQIPLDEESKVKTAFYTPFGIFVYKSLPMGYAASQDIFTDRFGRAVDDHISARCTEDCLITASSYPILLDKIEKFFAACSKAGIVLNTKKVQIGKEVIFGGFKLSKSSYTLDPNLHESIKNFPAPATLTQLRSFMGLINQTTNFTDEIAELANPLKGLLKKKNEFIWTAAHQEAFEKAREKLADPKFLAYYDHRRPTRLHTDASRLNGLGFVLKQQQDDKSWRIVQAGSRFLSSAETRYAMVELELLAIVWACKKARAFLEGIDFTVVTDHKPLLPILNDYALGDIENRRLQRLKEKLQHYRFKTCWVPGKENEEADALSRAPIRNPEPEDLIDEEDGLIVTSAEALEACCTLEGSNAVMVINEFEANLVSMSAKQIQEAAESDEDYQEVKRWLKKKYPEDPKLVEPRLSPYYRELERFHLDEDDLLCHDDRVVIPHSLRQRYLDLLVAIHAHPNKMKARARKSVWWPYMNSDINQRWRSCPTCVERSPSNPKEPTKPREPAEFPFQILHMDLATYSGKQFLIILDQFSGWPIVRNLGKEATTSTVTQFLLQVFENFGIPEMIFSDGGPQFISKEFEDFCREWMIQNDTSSPYHPQSNGIAEGTVKLMKRLIHCTFDSQRGTVDPKKWAQSILLFKNTPRGPAKLSPAEILFGRTLSDGIPATKANYLPKHQAATTKRTSDVMNFIKQTRDYKQKETFRVGQSVFVQDPHTKRWTEKAVIIRRGKNEREFWIRTSSGGEYRRNRRFLKSDPFKPTEAEPQLKPTSEETPRSPTDPLQPKSILKKTVQFEEPRRSGRSRRAPKRLSL